MRRADSNLFAPYKQIGVVCSSIRPVVRIIAGGQRRFHSLVCAVDNTLVHYRAEKLRLIAISDALPHNINAIVADKNFVYAAAGESIHIFQFCRQVIRTYPIGAECKHLCLLGSSLVVVDVSNNIRIINADTGETSLVLEWGSAFDVTAVGHPETYLNKIVLGSSDGRIRLINIRTGKIIYEFKSKEETPVTVLEQSTALDVIAIGYGSGLIELRNLKTDEKLMNFRHENRAISAIGFRLDGEPLMTSADSSGSLVVWNLDDEVMVGRISDAHSDSVQMVHFIPGEAIMMTSSGDNSVRSWVLDMPDGMPRQLVVLEGHAKPLTSMVFVSQNEVVCSGEDSSVRQYSLVNETLRQKLGSAGTMSKAKAKKKGIDEETRRMEPVVEMSWGWTREAAWDNTLCRHRGTVEVTTWTTRKKCQGTHRLLPERFKKETLYNKAFASSIAVSPCGNFAFVGYSTGHVDQMNVQSGRHVRTFHLPTKNKKNSNKEEDLPAHDSPVTCLSVDARGHELVSAGSSGRIRFWETRTGRPTASLQAPRGRISKGIACTVNSLLAIVLEDEKGSEGSVSVIDTLCHRVVRSFREVGGRVGAVAFSADGKWLLTADDKHYVRVWDLSTCSLIDVLLFDSPCIALGFNTTGEYLVTCHKNERGLFVWASKSHFIADLPILPLPANHLPTWNKEPGTIECVIDSDEDEDEMMREDRTPPPDHASLLEYSGLAPSRWANLPELSVIRERNKPIEPPKKPKRAPFFLTASATLEGFEFQKEEDDTKDREKAIATKRNLLEIESSFSARLKSAETTEELLDAFSSLKEMSVSAIDFQIRTLPPSCLFPFLRMLLTVLRSKRDFDLAQAYLASCIKIHRSELWKSSDEEMDALLVELAEEESSKWGELEEIFTNNLSMAGFARSALV